MLMVGIALTIAITLVVAFFFGFILLPNIYGQILTVITLTGWASFAIFKIVYGLRKYRDGLMNGRAEVAFGIGILATFATILII